MPDSLRCLVARLSILLVALVLAASNATGAPVTFAFEGEVTFFSTQRARDELGQLGVIEGSPIRGRYTFESGTAASGSPGMVQYAGAILAAEIEVSGWRATMGPAPAYNSIDVWSNFDLYRPLAEVVETPRILSPSAGRANFSISMTGSSGDPIQSDALPIGPPDLSAFSDGIMGVVAGFDGQLGFAIHSLTAVVDGEPLERISRGVGPTPALGDSDQPQLSASGSRLVFRSRADNLVPGDYNGQSDIFLREVSNSLIRLVSRNAQGRAGDGSSYSPKISEDGSTVVFMSNASDLVPGDINLLADVFVYDVGSESIERVNVDSLGHQALASSRNPAVDGDGSTVAFTSEADNLVVGDTNGQADVFVRDRATDSTIRVTASYFGTPADGSSDNPSLSADGRYVLFDSNASNLVPGDLNGQPDVFVHDRDSDADGVFDEPGAVSTIRVSVDDAGAEAQNGPSYAADLSADGRFVLMHSEAEGLVSGVFPSPQQLFLHDRDADGNGVFDEPGGIATRLLSVAAGGAQSSGDADGSQISADGRWVIFSSDSDDLVANDALFLRDVFLIDRDVDQDGVFDEPGQTAIEVVSLGMGGAPGDDESGGFTSGVTISGDGSLLAFESLATNLASNDVNGRSDVFVYSPVIGFTIPASESPFGADPDDYCDAPVVSADGRFVGHACYASNLVPGDDNLSRDVFRFDRITRTHEIASRPFAGDLANDVSGAPSISDDGQRVVFESVATNLVPGDGNAQQDVFLRDFAAGVTTRVSTSASGAEADGPSYAPGVSGDGRHVVFSSMATNLVPGDTNASRDVFVRDLDSGDVERVSVGAGGIQGDQDSGDEQRIGDGRVISGDGRFVVFQSTASNLVANDGNAQQDVFVRDRQWGTTERISVASDGSEANGPSTGATISANNRYVAFTSRASNLVPGDGNNDWDVFVRDRLLGTTELVSTTPGGGFGARTSGGSTGGVSISADGNLVAFRSFANDLVAGDTNGQFDVFVRDLASGTTHRVNLSNQGVQAAGASRAPSISAQGGHVVFESDADGLVGDDQNGFTDVYLATFEVDSDADGVPNADDNCPLVSNVDQADRDGDGIGDLCDNCADVPNASQIDEGGIDSTTPDGIGTRCQCGDVSDQYPQFRGIVSENDPRHLQSVFVGALNSAEAPEKCNVVGPPDLYDADGDGLPNDCDLVDWVGMKRAIAGVGLLGQQCGEQVSVAPGKGFTEELAAVFQEEKCGTCHGFTNVASGKRLAHEADNRLQPGANVTSSATCQGCHNEALGFSDDWRAAPPTMDWTGLDPIQICELIKSNTPSVAMMEDHFRNDVRILWSLERIGLDENVWFAMADRWIDGGLRCE